MRTAVVTGGASGIGLAIAERLAKDGYRVAALDLNPSDTSVVPATDVADRAQVDAALAAVRSGWDRSRSWSTRPEWTASSASPTSPSRPGIG